MFGIKMRGQNGHTSSSNKNKKRIGYNNKQIKVLKNQEDELLGL